jgi:hypothetical protein
MPDDTLSGFGFAEADQAWNGGMPQQLRSETSAGSCRKSGGFNASAGLATAFLGLPGRTETLLFLRPAISFLGLARRAKAALWSGIERHYHASR